MTVALTRLPHLTRAEFQDYWFDNHGPLVRSLAEVLGIVEYVQLHSLDDGSSGAITGSRWWVAPYDGLAEVWYSSREDFDARMSNAAAREAARQLREDELRFIDTTKCPRWWACARRIK
jgi:uncharacterized protein (TIGR02118 family)